VRDIDKVMAALTSPVRRDILGLIWERELPAGEIAASFALTKPTISQHLAVLREAGLVTMAPAGTSRRYRARHEALQGLHAALEASTKWTAADDTPERDLPDSKIKPMTVATVDVETDQATTFRAFTDPEVYSRWMGVPVRIADGEFATTLEWGTEVRGRYELVAPPELIVMKWDFEDDNVPIPGGLMTGYLWVRPRPRGGARVEVHQLVDTQPQAEFMKAAWRLVLGRLKTGVVAASDRKRSIAPRSRRAKMAHGR